MQTIIQDLRRQGHVLGITDVAGLLLLVIVLGAAVAGLILLVPARRPVPAPAALPAARRRWQPAPKASGLYGLYP